MAVIVPRPPVSPSQDAFPSVRDVAERTEIEAECSSVRKSPRGRQITYRKVRGLGGAFLVVTG